MRWACRCMSALAWHYRVYLRYSKAASGLRRWEKCINVASRQLPPLLTSCFNVFMRLLIQACIK